MARDFCLNTGSVRKALFGALAASALGWSPAVAEEAADDLQHLRPLINQTLETEKSGVEIGWSDPATGHSGTLRVERTFYRDQQPCREYLRTIERAGASTLVTRGVGCRVGRAQWEIEEEGATARALLPGRAAPPGRRPRSARPMRRLPRPRPRHARVPIRRRSPRPARASPSRLPSPPSRCPRGATSERPSHGHAHLTQRREP